MHFTAPYASTRLPRTKTLSPFITSTQFRTTMTPSSCHFHNRAREGTEVWRSYKMPPCLGHFLVNQFIFFSSQSLIITTHSIFFRIWEFLQATPRLIHIQFISDMSFSWTFQSASLCTKKDVLKHKQASSSTLTKCRICHWFYLHLNNWQRIQR